MRRWMFAAAAACGLAAALAPASPAEAARNRNRPARIVVTPSGATLGQGQTVQFSAQALNAAGQVMPGVVFTWSANRSSIVSISSSGLATARGLGIATITARGGGKNAKFTVSVAGS